MGCQQSVRPTAINRHSAKIEPILLQITQIKKESLEIISQIEKHQYLILKLTKTQSRIKPNIFDSYIVWSILVAICNSGELSKTQLPTFRESSQDVTLGSCGDLRLLWCGELFLEYQKLIENALIRIPQNINHLNELHNQIISVLYENNLELNNYQQQITDFNETLSRLEDAQTKIGKDKSDLNLITKKISGIISQSNKIGSELFKEFGATEYDNKLYLKVKISTIVSRFTEIQKSQQKNSTKFEHLQIKHKRFPWKFEKTNIDSVDKSIDILSVYLEQHAKHLLSIRKCKNTIKYLTKSFLTDDNSILQAWEMFCMSIKIKDQKAIESLRKIICKNPEQEKCRQSFIEYHDLFHQDKLQELEEMWTIYTQNNDKIINLWANNDLLNMAEFKYMSKEQSYKALITLNKNILALRQYHNVANRVYQETYSKKIRRGKEFLLNYQTIYDLTKYKQEPFNEIYLLFKENQDATKKARRAVKYQYLYEKQN